MFTVERNILKVNLQFTHTFLKNKILIIARKKKGGGGGGGGGGGNVNVCRFCLVR